MDTPFNQAQSKLKKKQKKNIMNGSIGGLWTEENTQTAWIHHDVCDSLLSHGQFLFLSNATLTEDGAVIHGEIQSTAQYL